MSVETKFSKSMLKAIIKMAGEVNCPEDQIQIALELSAKEEVIYKVCKNFAHIKTVKLDDILFLSAIDSMFKSLIPGKIKNCLKQLSKKEESNFVTVFIMKSKLPDTVRAMLYVKGTYKSELSNEQIVSL